MRPAAQRFTQVTGQTADIGARAAGDPQPQPLGLLLQYLDGMDLDLALGRLDGVASAGLHIKRFPALLERGIDRRTLQDVAQQRRDRRLQGLGTDRRHRPLEQHLALGIIGIGGLAQHDLGVVGLGRAQQQAGDLGGLAEAQRQQPGGQRVKAAGVAALFRTEQATGDLQRGVGAHAGRLVEQQDAIQAAELNSGHDRYG
ncbi:hypothetical protein D3C73_1214150 [compost metagenome]